MPHTTAQRQVAEFTRACARRNAVHPPSVRKKLCAEWGCGDHLLFSLFSLCLTKKCGDRVSTSQQTQTRKVPSPAKLGTHQSTHFPCGILSREYLDAYENLMSVTVTYVCLDDDRANAAQCSVFRSGECVKFPCPPDGHLCLGVNPALSAYRSACPRIRIAISIDRSNPLRVHTTHIVCIAFRLWAGQTGGS